MTPAVKAEISSVLGVVIAGAGNILPYITPETLTSLGLSEPWVRGVSAAVGLILLAYRGGKTASASVVVAPVSLPPTQGTK